jgi:predicted Rossmann fold flavoprotein
LSWNLCCSAGFDRLSCQINFRYHFSAIAHPVHKFDVIILGAGAAGLLCAAEVGKRRRSVALLERSDRIGRKILISGGGRANFTNLYCTPENFISANPHFAKSALARYKPQDFIALVEKHQIPYHEKTLGQLFCDHSAGDITGMLEAECRFGNVEIVLNARIREVSHAGGFVVQTASDEFRAAALVVATGGLSIPKIGATSLGYDLARQFQLNVIPTRPALVPLTFSARDRGDYCDLAGVSAQVIASVGESASRQTFREAMLITHRGLSGPAILQVSSYWQPGKPIRIDLAPGMTPTADLRAGSTRNLAALRSALQAVLPQRLAVRWLDLHPPTSLNNQGIDDLERELHCWELVPAGTEGYEKAEVTAGGVDTDELSSKTMESRKVPGLFFIGEVVDVTGHLGGFNFQWAWSSAFAAAQAL